MGPFNEEIFACSVWGKHTLPGCSAAQEGKGLFRMRKTYLARLFSSAGGQGFVQKKLNIPCPAVQLRMRARSPPWPRTGVRPWADPWERAGASPPPAWTRRCSTRPASGWSKQSAFQLSLKLKSRYGARNRFQELGLELSSQATLAGGPVRQPCGCLVSSPQGGIKATYTVFSLYTVQVCRPGRIEWFIEDQTLYVVIWFLNNLWGARNQVGKCCRSGPPGYIDWRNEFLGIDSWAP